MAKVLSIIPYTIFPAKLGGQKGIALFNEYLAKELELVCVTVKSNDPRYASYPVINILSDASYRYINPFYFFTIKSIINKQQATHLLLEHPYYGWLGVLLKWFTGVRLIVHSHNIEATRWKSLGKWWWKILWFYERKTHREADYNFFIQDNDKEYAIARFGLAPSRCTTITYGLEWNRAPSREEVQEARLQIRHKHNIAPEESILLFNGAFNYQPNLSALLKIVDTIDPLLQQITHFRYRIIICGKDIPEEITRVKHNSIIFPGFVDDISVYFKAADVFLNPVSEGGGIKTKLVEALGYNLNTVSTLNGAIGVDPGLCNGKLFICDDGDWQGFANYVVSATLVKADIGPQYFDHFFWGNSISRVVRFLQPAT